MYTKQDLMENLHTLGVDPHGTLMVHMAYKAMGEIEGRGDTVLDALAEYMQPGLLVMPAHTWANVGQNNPVMDALYTPTCIGTLPELFRKRPGVLRSLHPTHSVSVLGADAEAFVAGEETITTPCGEGGVYHKLWQRDAQILLLGVNFARNTYVHGIEEWDGGAEKTISKEKTDLYVIRPEGGRLYTPQYRHCAPIGSETFPKLEPQAVQEGVLTIGSFGDATARSMRAKPLRAMVAALLRQNPAYLLHY